MNDNNSVWYFDILARFRTSGSDQFGVGHQFAATATAQRFRDDFQFKFADLEIKLSESTSYSSVTDLPDVTTKVYWIGFFNSVEEIRAYVDQTETSAN